MRKCISEGGRKPPSRSDIPCGQRVGSWLADHYWLDYLLGFFLGYEVRRIKFQRRSTKAYLDTKRGER